MGRAILLLRQRGEKQGARSDPGTINLERLLGLPQQKQRLPCLHDIIRLDQEFLHGHAFHALLGLHGDLKLHGLQNRDNLLTLKHIPFLDFDFPHVGVERRFDRCDVRVCSKLGQGDPDLGADKYH